MLTKPEKCTFSADFPSFSAFSPLHFTIFTQKFSLFPQLLRCSKQGLNGLDLGHFEDKISFFSKDEGGTRPPSSSPPESAFPRFPNPLHSFLPLQSLPLFSGFFALFCLHGCLLTLLGRITQLLRTQLWKLVFQRLFLPFLSNLHIIFLYPFATVCPIFLRFQRFFPFFSDFYCRVFDNFSIFSVIYDFNHPKTLFLMSKLFQNTLYAFKTCSQTFYKIQNIDLFLFIITK